MHRLETNLIHAQELSPYEVVLSRGGLAADRMFEDCGIPSRAVQDSTAMITMRQAYQFAEMGARSAGSEVLGSLAGREVRFSDLGPLGEAVREAPCLCCASERLQAAMHATEPGSRMWIDVCGEVAWLLYRPQVRFPTGGVQAEQFDLQCMLQIVRSVAGASWRPEKVRVSVTPDSVVRRVDEFADAAIDRCRHTTGIAFPIRRCDRPAEHFPPGGATMDAWGVTCTPDAPSQSSAVKAVLCSLSRFGHAPSLDALAGRFGVSGRTMQRALGKEGVSYRDLTGGGMVERAMVLLEQESTPIKAISVELGYTSTNSFVRAFKKAAGVTPGAFRRGERLRPGSSVLR